jgi:hypothetical protein
MMRAQLSTLAILGILLLVRGLGPGKSETVT